MIFFDLGWTLEDEGPGQTDRAERTASIAAGWGFSFSADQLLALQAEAGTAGAPAVYPAALAALGLGAERHRELRRLVPWNPGLCRLYPEVRSVLERMSATHRLGVLANQSRPMGPRLDSYGIAGIFSVSLCSCEVGLEKPDPALFSLAEARARAVGDPGPHWMVGDRLDNDIVPARARGWRTVRVLRGDYGNQPLRTVMETPDRTVRSLDEL